MRFTHCLIIRVCSLASSQAPVTCSPTRARRRRFGHAMERSRDRRPHKIAAQLIRMGSRNNAHEITLRARYNGHAIRKALLEWGRCRYHSSRGGLSNQMSEYIQIYWPKPFFSRSSFGSFSSLCSAFSLSPARIGHGHKRSKEQTRKRGIKRKRQNWFHQSCKTDQQQADVVFGSNFHPNTVNGKKSRRFDTRNQWRGTQLRVVHF